MLQKKTLQNKHVQGVLFFLKFSNAVSQILKGLRSALSGSAFFFNISKKGFSIRDFEFQILLTSLLNFQK